MGVLYLVHVLSWASAQGVKMHVSVACYAAMALLAAGFVRQRARSLLGGAGEEAPPCSTHHARAAAVRYLVRRRGLGVI